MGVLGSACKARWEGPLDSEGAFQPFVYRRYQIERKDVVEKLAGVRLPGLQGFGGALSFVGTRLLATVQIDCAFICPWKARACAVMGSWGPGC